MSSALKSRGQVLVSRVTAQVAYSEFHLSGNGVNRDLLRKLAFLTALPARHLGVDSSPILELKRQVRCDRRNHYETSTEDHYGIGLRSRRRFRSIGAGARKGRRRPPGR